MSVSTFLAILTLFSSNITLRNYKWHMTHDEYSQTGRTEIFETDRITGKKISGSPNLEQ